MTTTATTLTAPQRAMLDRVAAGFIEVRRDRYRDDLNVWFSDGARLERREGAILDRLRASGAIAMERRLTTTVGMRGSRWALVATVA